MPPPTKSAMGLYAMLLGSSILTGRTIFAQQCSIPNYRVLTVALPGFTNVLSNSTASYYTGFIIDLLYAMARVGNFTFTISLGKDSDFGSLIGTTAGGPCYGGGVGQLQAGAYDIFAAALDDVYGYNQVIDLTTPIFRSDVQVIYNTRTGLTNSFYSVLPSTAGRDLLAISQDPRLQAIYAKVQQFAPASLPDTYDKAIAQVTGGGWALFGRTPAIDQAVCHSNGVIAKDPTVYKRTYASFGVQKGSNIRNKLNLAILRLQEDNIVDAMLAKWFPCSNFACS